MTEGRFRKNYDRKWTQILILLGFCFLLYFLNLGRWDLWDPDEPRYAQIAREMVNRGDWILMHYNGKVYGHKPPLFFWLIGLSSYLWQGFTSFSVRFPPALFGTLTVLITFFFGNSLFAAKTGLFSGLILATSLQFTYLSTRANIDTTLSFFTIVSLFCFFQWYRYGRDKAKNVKKGEVEVKVEEKARVGNLWIYGFYIGIALATLAKGPVGFILPFLVCFIYLIVQRDWKGIKGMRLLPGILLFMIIIFSWYLPAVLSGGKAYLQETLFKHTVEAYSKGWTHPRPIYYYLYSFPMAFLPWIFFLPAAIVYGLSKTTIGKRKGFLFLLVWCIVIFTFFSLSKSKRTLYLLPLFPAASLMVGKFWDDLISHPLDQFRRGWISLPLYGFIGFGLIAGAATPWVASIKFPPYLSYSVPIAFLFAGCSIVMLIFYRLKNYGGILFLLIGMMVAGYFYTFRVIFPLANSHMSARFISEEITSRIQPGDKLAVYRAIGTDPYNYYTGIVPILIIGTQETLLELVGSSERVFCLLNFSDFRQLINTKGKSKVQLIARRRVRNDDVVLISNQPLAPRQELTR